MRPNLLLLGGTTEATQLAQVLAQASVSAVFSYAGRVASPRAQPLPVRVGGFGGVAGLSDYIAAQKITHVVDATHPFAAQMSTHAVAACHGLNVPLVALTRKPWVAVPGDDWIHVPDITSAAKALPKKEKNVFLAIGRMHLAAFARLPLHTYLVRLIEPPVNPPFPRCQIEVAQGPFTVEGDLALMRRHHTELIVSKNAGGPAAYAKIEAARALRLPVVMIDRPAIPERAEVHAVQAVMDWMAHSGTLRGV